MALAVTIPETSNSVPGWRTSFQLVKSKPTLLQTHWCLSHLRCDSVCIALALVTAVLAHTEIVAHIKKSPPSPKSSSRIYNQNDNCNYVKSSIKFTSRSRKLRRRMKKCIWLKCSWMQNSQALVYNYTAVDVYIYIKRERQRVSLFFQFDLLTFSYYFTPQNIQSMRASKSNYVKRLCLVVPLMSRP